MMQRVFHRSVEELHPLTLRFSKGHREVKATLQWLARRSGLRCRRLASLRLRCERSLIAFSRANSGESHGRILCYHSVGTRQWGVNDVSPARFRRQIEHALKAGYRFVPASVIATGNAGGNELAVTFDDGLSSVATNAAPVLSEYGIPWTLFVVSDWAEGAHSWGADVVLDWAEIERLAAGGATIGSHSVSHPNFARLSITEAMEELSESRRRIEDRLGIETREFAIPFGTSRDWTPKAGLAAREAGYEFVYSQSETLRAPSTIGRTFVTRFDGDRIFQSALSGAFDQWEERA